MSSPESQSESAVGGKNLRLDDALALADRLQEELQQRMASTSLAAQQRHLEMLVAQAQEGDGDALKTWLVEHGHATQGDHSLAQSFPCGPEAVHEPASEQDTLTWDSILPFAQERIAGLCTGSSLALSGTVDSDTEQVSGPADASQSQPSGRADQSRLDAIALAEPQESDTKKSLRKRIFGSSLGGAVSSLVAHILLIFLLGFITLKLPGPPAGMALQSATVSEPLETVSLLEPTAADSPTTEPAEFEPVSVSDTADQLADIDAKSLEFGELTSDVGSTTTASRAAAVVAASSAAASSDASFFGAAASGNCFCYVIDGSGSMRGGPWQAAKFELLKSLSSLKPDQRFYIIFFNRKLTAITEPDTTEPASHALYATAENLQHARRWVDTLQIGVGAPPTKALELAISKEPDAIYLLTDGVTKVDVAKGLRESNRVADLINGEQIRVPIHSIAFYSLEGQALLRQIASENNGQFIYVPDPTRKK